MSGKKFLLPCFAFLFCSQVFAQSYIFKNFGTAEGLPHSKVNCILQTADGYIWIGTEGGLSRFDGISFTNFSSSDSLAESNAKALAEDNAGNLWIGHSNGSLSLMSGKNFRKISIPLKDKPTSFFSVLKDTDGRLWLSSLGGGAIRINANHAQNLTAGDFEQFSKKDGLESDVFFIFKDHLGVLWFVTEMGVKTFSEKEKTFSLFKHDRMTNYHVTSMSETPEGDILFSTYQGGIARWKREKNEFEFYNEGNGLPLNDIFMMMRDTEKNTWIGTWGLGAAKFDGKKFESFSKHEGLAGNKVRAFCEDRENNVWMGTNEDGLSCFKGKQFSLFSKSDGLQNEKVNAVIQDKKGMFWIGTQDGIAVMELNEQGRKKTVRTISLKDKLSNSEVISLALDQHGNIVAGTRGGGAAIINSSNYTIPKTFTSLGANFVYSIVCDKNGVLWFGTVSGINTYNEKDNSYVNYGKHNGLAGNDITCEFIDSKNNIWIGARGEGLMCYQAGSKKFLSFGPADGLMHKSPVSICESTDGKIWIGTEGGGVFQYDGKKFSHLGIQEGLSSEYITFVNTGSGNKIFIGTNKGICFWDTKENKMRVFNKADGIASDESRPNSSFTDKQDNLWFGTGNGLVRYSPAFDKPTTTEPKTYITQYRIFLNAANVNKDTILTHSQFNVSFNFVGLSYTSPENVKYQYMLEGFEDKWSPASAQNFATYTNLGHGRYTFKVRAAGSNGIWNKVPSSFTFVILPPWWLTTWAYSSYALILIGGPILYTRWRTAKLIKDKQVLEQQVEERTIEIAQKNVKLESANAEILANRDEIAEKNKDITDSIQYAKRIQEAILPRNEEIAKNLPDSFVLFKPRDIVSGDFYWFGVAENSGNPLQIIACADCTGHGVPGAFLTMIGNNILNQIVLEHKNFSPGKILSELNNRIKAALKQEGAEGGSRDGMDIAVCCIDLKTKEIIYAAANRPLFYIKDGNIETVSADKVAIAGFTPENYIFTEHRISLDSTMPFYLFSDGYGDQFGGPAGKKFMQKKLKELLVSIHQKSMAEQKTILDKTIVEWMKDVEQIDDISAIGVRI